MQPTGTSVNDLRSNGRKMPFLTENVICSATLMKWTRLVVEPHCRSGLRRFIVFSLLHSARLYLAEMCGPLTLWRFYWPLGERCRSADEHRAAAARPAKTNWKEKGKVKQIKPTTRGVSDDVCFGTAASVARPSKRFVFKGNRKRLSQQTWRLTLS